MSNSRSQEMEPGDLVWVYECRDRLKPKWVQGTVLQRLGPLAYTVEAQGGTRHVHRDHLQKSGGVLDTSMKVPQENPV